MEHVQIHKLHEPSYFTELLECSMGTATSFDMEKPSSPNIIQDNFSIDQFMERLLQIETELGNEIGPNNTNGNNSTDQVSQEKSGISIEENHFDEFQELVGVKSSFDLLLSGAKAVEAANWPLACNVIARLTNILSDGNNKENPFNNLVLYFTRGLFYKSRNACEFLQELLPSQTVTRPTFRMLLGLSPYVKFVQFTANQAILEVTQDESELHVIDFDIMEGIQWPPLMADLALRKNVSMRMTAIIMDPKSACMVKQTGRRLTEFADSIDLFFKFDQMVVNKEDDFDRIEVGQALIANCAIHQLHMPIRNFSLVGMFLNGVSRLSPKMVVLVEEELLNFARITSISFGEFFSEAFQHYAALTDSLVHTFSTEGFTLIGREIMGPRILDCVRKFPIERKERMIWGDVFSSFKCLKPIPMSPCNVSQAKLLAGIFGSGYWVQHQDCRLSLCWKGRPLTTASVWVPNTTSSAGKH